MARTPYGTPPTYQLHRPTGCARVRVNGKIVWLGRYGSPESREKYAKIVDEWRKTLIAKEQKISARMARGEPLIDEAIADYMDWVSRRYVKMGKPTSEVDIQRLAMSYLSDAAGPFNVSEFTPLRLAKLIDVMIASKLKRTTITALQSRIVRLFKWLAAREMCQITVYQSLVAVEHLRAGRPTDSGLIAEEPEPVQPVSAKHVAMAMEKLPPVVCDMIRFQRRTGARPGEVCRMTPAEISRQGDVWEWRPIRHKSQHRGKERVIPVGPRARMIIAKYLSDRLPTERCFPFEPMAYREKIASACKQAGIPAWKPNQLRHARATELAERFDSEAAQVTLGHSNLNTTQIYAQRSLRKAKAIAAQVG